MSGKVVRRRWLMTLAETFVDLLPAEIRERWRDADQLATTLAKVLATARLSHPSIVGDDAAFAGRLAMVVGEDPASLAALPIADLYLAFACAKGEPNSAEIFVRAYGPVVDRMLDKASRHGDRDERRQIALTQILAPGVDTPPKIDGYRGRGSLRSWVRVVAARLAIDMLRKPDRVELAADPELLAALGNASPPALAGEVAQYEGALRHAVQDAFDQLEAGERRLLRHRFAGGMTTEQLAVELAVHRTTVARRVELARAKLAALARASLRARLRVDEATADSLMGLLPDQLEISVQRLLQSRPDPDC